MINEVSLELINTDGKQTAEINFYLEAWTVQKNPQVHTAFICIHIST